MTHISFEDKEALDTYILLSGLSTEEASELRRRVEEAGYGEKVKTP